MTLLVDLAIIVAVAAVGLLLFWPRVYRITIWRAAVTPLASIIGSGFLVLAPILVSAYGSAAPLVMAGLCLGAYAFGSAIRFNIAWRAEQPSGQDTMTDQLELAASWALVFAFMISVAYYLNLFGAFGVSLTRFDTPADARILTSMVYAIILIVGWTRGFKALERMEYSAVAVKLAIIAGLIVGLTFYFYRQASGGNLFVHSGALAGWPSFTLAFGLIITVQGFETSRYLGGNYDAKTRIASMRFAQLVSAFIYMIYIGLFAYSFDRGEFQLSETAIIDMMALVAPVLPVLLVAAALSAQFSAAIADTSGSGGLLVELTRGRMSARNGYALLVAVGLFLTWEADIFHIIAYASRAFALYYAIQAAIAARTAFLNKSPLTKRIGFLLLAILGIVIVLFGQDVESGIGS